MTTGWLKIHLTAAATVDACVFQYLQPSTQPYVPAPRLLRLSKNLIEQSVSRCEGM